MNDYGIFVIILITSYYIVMQTIGDINETYFETNGNHVVNLSDGSNVSISAFPDWDAWTCGTEELVGEDIDVILSPELITAPYHPGLITDNKGQICNRIIDVQGQSARNRGTTYLLGSPDFTNKDKPTNSLLIIRDGLRFGQLDKFTLGGFEAPVFTVATELRSQVLPGSDASICIDTLRLATGKRISENASNLFISACWAVPLYPDDPKPHSRDRHVDTLKRVVDMVFANAPNLQDVVVCDRVSEVSGLDSSLSAHFQRSSEYVRID